MFQFKNAKHLINLVLKIIMTKIKNEQKYTFGDILDALFTIGGFGLSVIICIVAFFEADFMVSKALFFLQTLGLIAGGTGLTRRLLRQKQKQIEELEELVPPHLLPNNTQNTNQTLSSANSPQKPFYKLPNYEDSLEARFLEALIYKKGKITMVEAVILLRESVDKIIPIIENLQSKGIIGTEIAENGQLVYVSI